jgi:hypothetical protein
MPQPARERHGPQRTNRSIIFILIVIFIVIFILIVILIVIGPAPKTALPASLQGARCATKQSPHSNGLNPEPENFPSAGGAGVSPVRAHRRSPLPPRSHLHPLRPRVSRSQNHVVELPSIPKLRRRR